ncbi:MAG TPA: carbonic anhydrase [Mariprofundaceae bacterium]|nr:carbonic anhydrase [Mariprofundaceae bacterium]
MSVIRKLLDYNRQWAERLKSEDPAFFAQLAENNAPELLWIGCSDGRVSPDRLIGRPLGKIFVHRNIANIFAMHDLNCLAVLQFAVEVLKIPDIVVCGHYGCAGIRQAIEGHSVEPVDLWVEPVRHLARRQRDELANITDPVEKTNRLAELNVAHQVRNICRSAIAQQAWEIGQPLAVHGLIYHVEDGLLHEVMPSVTSAETFRALTE